MDIAILAQNLVSILGPILPSLVGVAQGAAGEIVGEATIATASKLWVKLHPKIENKPAVTEAALDLAFHPDDQDAQASLRLQLKKLLADDSDLANELAAIIAEVRFLGNTVTANGKRSIAIGGNTTYSTIITGDNNVA